MKERPIIFTGESVKAILEGRKTMTRRVAKIICDIAARHENIRVRKLSGREVWSINRDAMYTPALREPFEVACRYGVPGDRLWVRETFVLEPEVDGEPPTFGDGRPTLWEGENGKTWVQAHYRATDPTPELSCTGGHKCDGSTPCCHWRPSIFMPRWASRLTLEITDLGVERVQDISKQDALAEGIEALKDQFNGCFVVAEEIGKGGGMSGTTAKECFQRIWDSINAKRGYGWDVNPWVWVISFKQLK